MHPGVLRAVAPSDPSDSGSVTDRIPTELHWVDIPSRVTVKMCVLAYRCIHGSAPSYLARYFTPVSAITGRSQLRSAATSVLFVPRSNTSTIGPRDFAISSFSAWNSLPVDLHDPGLCLLSLWSGTQQKKIPSSCWTVILPYFSVYSAHPCITRTRI